MLEENKKIVSDKALLFAATQPKEYYLRIAENSEEYLKIWVKEPTWLQVEQALSSVVNINSKSQDMDLDLNKMYRYMVENFIEKTEPSLTAIDLLRLTPFMGNQLKEALLI